MEKVKFGVIGIGNMGSWHCDSIRHLPECELRAVCDINPAAFDRIDRSGISCFDSAEAFFADGSFDAVLISVPHYFHIDLALEAMRHGKHIIVEKPIAVHTADARRLLDGARACPGLVKSAMFNQRTIGAHRKLKQLIDSGELGTIRRINWIITDWFRTQFYYDSGDWRASWAGEGGGVLLNQCPHQLDLMQWFFGMPSRVRAVAALGKYHDIEVEDEVTAILEYPSGATGVFIASTGEAPGTNRLEITADRGKLLLEDGRLTFFRTETPVSEFCRTCRKKFAVPEVWHIEIPAAAANPAQHRDIIANVAAAIRTGEALIAPLEEGIRGLELGNAMLLAGLTGQMISLPMDPEPYAAMLKKLAAASRYVRKTAVPTPDNGEDFSSSF